MTQPDPFRLPLRQIDDANRVMDAVQALLTHAGIVFRPAPPFPTSCCGRGCNGCVWEGFFSALHYWREEAAGLLVGADDRGRSFGVDAYAGEQD
ncbi:MAG: oxidoreductase-like domain-containing protein [Azoarcus sp.]|jgi:hypothetical protein|nr:oxidoreductase-like domain-containing protein [Azoarcus sp.]